MHAAVDGHPCFAQVVFGQGHPHAGFGIPEEGGEKQAGDLRVVGAVGMVEMALEQLSAKNVVELDDERRAAMVSNLMVVLCGERDTQPVVNTGTLYQ